MLKQVNLDIQSQGFHFISFFLIFMTICTILIILIFQNHLVTI